jgi:hypothetical protein
MFQIIGIVVLFAMVFGSYVLAGGKFGVILHALPYEMMAIGGAGVAAFMISNSPRVIKATLSGLGKCFAGVKWKPSDYRDLLSLLFLLTKTMKTKGVIALKAHREAHRERDLLQVPEDHEGPLRRGLHLRHASHDDHEPGGPPPGRGRHGEAAREASPRGAGSGACAAEPG